MSEDGTDDHPLTSHKSHKLLCSLVHTELSYRHYPGHGDTPRVSVSWHTCNAPHNPRGLPPCYVPEALPHQRKYLALSFQMTHVSVEFGVQDNVKDCLVSETADS